VYNLLWIILANFLVSLISLVGIFILGLKKGLLNKLVVFLVSLSAGVLMGGAFLHLLPEALETGNGHKIFSQTLLAFIIFFLLERVLWWRHCHKEHCPLHTFGHMNLIGDAIHNFVDGMIIAGGIITNPALGTVVTLAVVFHEIPQEIGDFGVLIYSGFHPKKALSLNFLTALFSILGGIFGYFLSFQIQTLGSFLIPFAAGGFIYIAASDLIPEIRKETEPLKSLVSLGVFLFGVVLMIIFRLIE